MKESKKISIAVASVLIMGSVAFAGPSSGLLAIDYAGTLYNVSKTDASLAAIGSTGVAMGSLEFASDGTLYGFSAGSGSTLYEVDPATAAVTTVGPLGLDFVFEGGLAFSDRGVAYGTNQGSATAPTLFTLDVSSGAATTVGVISGGDHDIDGLAWRGDGTLIGLDRVTNSLLEIHPTTAASSILSSLNPTVGDVGGMAVLDGMGYFATANTSGSNELYAFDLYTGAYGLVGNFGSSISPTGISGLAAWSTAPIPAPGAIMLGSIGAGLVGWLRKRRTL